MTRLIPYGDRAWLVDDPRDPVATARLLRSWAWPQGAYPEVVVGATTCLIKFHGRAPSSDEVAAALCAAPAAPGRTERAAAEVVVPVRYDGEDLQAVAEAVGCSVSAVVALHTSGSFRVAFLGFAPGFAYLEGLPRALHLPRRSTPRVRVPAGAVAIADRYSAVYPAASPGGWHLLGTTEVVLFDSSASVPALLAPGTAVRFVAVG